MDRAAYPTGHQKLVHTIHRGSLWFVQATPSLPKSYTLTQSTRRAAHIYFSHISLRYLHAPHWRLRDRAGPGCASQRIAVAFRCPLVALIRPTHVLRTSRSRLWCAVALSCTLVVWGAPESAPEFALSVRVLSSRTVSKERNEGAFLRDPEFRHDHRCSPVSTDDGFGFPNPLLTS